MNQHYSITVPFTINWRLAAPRDFRTLEYFLTPQVSFVFHDITNGRQKFLVGSYLMQDANKEAQFEREVLPQRSQERINDAFRREDISAFFSFEAAEGLKQLFETEGFICRRVEIHYMGRPVEIASLPPEDVQRVLHECARLHVIRALDFSEKADVYQNMYSEIYDAVERKMQREQADKEAKVRGMTKKRLWTRAGIGTALIGASATLLFVSRKLFGRGGWVGILSGIGCAVASVAAGGLGRMFADETVEYVRKGLILRYV